ncbi:MAG: hypothetical protein LBL44_13445 [Treponema sp.]|jgi:hypothetical protein|nr:hypothetical protein [Treponema sp.]
MNSTNSNNQHLYTNPITNSNPVKLIWEEGCAITAIANLAFTLGLNDDPIDVNANNNYVTNGGVSWLNVSMGLGLTLTPGTGQFTHTIYNTQESDTANNFYTIVKVQYNAANSDHWVGVRGIHTGSDGTEYIVISPTSVNDSGFANNPNSVRYQQGWREGTNGDVYVPVNKITAYKIYSAPIEP